MNIQQATPSDLVEIAYLVKVCDSEIRLRGCLPYHVVLHNLEEETGKGHIYLYRKGNATLGMIWITDHDETLPANSEKKACEEYYIRYLLVHPYWKYQHIENDLLEFVETQAHKEDIHVIRSATSSLNEQMIGVFEGKGYEKTDEKFYPFQKTPFYNFEKRI